MAANKTQPGDGDVVAFLDAIEPAQRRADAQAVCALMARASGEPAIMWGPSIVGFGRRRYAYESGREGETCRIGFSPRKAALTFYGMGITRQADLLARLGKHEVGKGCLYIKALKDIDLAVLERMAEAGYAGDGQPRSRRSSSIM